MTVVPSRVHRVIHLKTGSMVYVSTSDGRFWEYDTSHPEAVIHLAGYSGPWPRFRRNNHGLAQP